MTDDTKPVESTEAGADEAQTTQLADALAAPAVSEAPKAKAAKTEAPPEAKPENEQPFWYRKEIEKERKARQAAERRAQELETRGGQREPQNLPHPGQDPQGFYSHFETQRLMDRLERSEDRFIDKHGDAEFEATKDWLATRPDIEEAALKQRHPWGYVHEIYRREKIADEIGNDPDAWREQERQRLRAEWEAEQEQGYSPQPGMAAQPRLPTPAAGVRSTAPRAGYAGPTPLAAALKR